MFADERPARRAGVDSPRANEPTLRPADRHARRLGVLGSVECAVNPAALPRAPAAVGRIALLDAARTIVPIVTATCPEVIAAATVLPFPMAAA